MNPEQLSLAIVMIVSVLLSFSYAVFLEHIHDRYAPNWIWLTVVVGNGLVIGTLWFIEQRLFIMLTSVIVFEVNIAWGLPIVGWQLWQWHHRIQQQQEA